MSQETPRMPEEPWVVTQLLRQHKTALRPVEKAAADYIDTLCAALAASQAEAQRERERADIEVEAFYAERERAEKAKARCRELENEIKQLNKDLDAEEAEHAEHIAQAKFELSRLEADARRYEWALDNPELTLLFLAEATNKDTFAGLKPTPDIVKGYVNRCIDAAIDAATAWDGGEDE